MTKLFSFILFLSVLVIFGQTAEPNSSAEKTHKTDIKPSHSNELEHKHSPVVNNGQDEKDQTKIKSEKPLDFPLSKEKPKLPAVVDHSPEGENKNTLNTDKKKTITQSEEKILPSFNGSDRLQQESKLVTTGSMVLISISLLFIVFVAFKTYRRKSRNARIKKYGIRLARSNIEMAPLPLDNDDDDETIFDLKNVS